MKYETYEDLIEGRNLQVFEFKSVGKHGPILKRIAFVKTELPFVYNLVFGNVNENNEIDDFSNSNNGDRNKILARLQRLLIYIQINFLNDGFTSGVVQKKEQDFTGWR